MGKLYTTAQVRGSSNRIERRGLMDALDESQALIWFDASGMIVDANENALRLFGYSECEIRQQDYFALCHHTKPELADKRDWNRIAQGETVHTERSFWSKDGSEVWVSVNFAAIRNASGTTRRVVAIVIDLSPFAWKPNDVRRAR